MMQPLEMVTGFWVDFFTVPPSYSNFNEKPLLNVTGGIKNQMS